MGSEQKRLEAEREELEQQKIEAKRKNKKNVQSYNFFYMQIRYPSYAVSVKV